MSREMQKFLSRGDYAPVAEPPIALSTAQFTVVLAAISMLCSIAGWALGTAVFNLIQLLK